MVRSVIGQFPVLPVPKGLLGGAEQLLDDLVDEVHAALAAMKIAEAKHDELTKDVRNKRDRARELVVKLHGMRPDGAKTAWTAEQAGCSQRLVQLFLQEFKSTNPEAAHDALKERNKLSQRGRRARQRGPATVPNANDIGPVIRATSNTGDTAPVVTPAPMKTEPVTNALAVAKADVEKLTDDELEDFETWYVDFYRKRHAEAEGEPPLPTEIKAAIEESASQQKH